MILNYMEQCILVAEKDYRTIEDRVNFVNQRLKRIKIKKIDKDTIIIKRNPNSQDKPISKYVYYRKLGELTKKTRERGQQISKSYLTEVINEHDTLIEDRKEMRDLIEKAKSLDKIQTAVIAKRDQIDIGRRILAVKELIKVQMEEPDLEDEEQIERQIQLLTS